MIKNIIVRVQESNLFTSIIDPLRSIFRTFSFSFAFKYIFSLLQLSFLKPPDNKISEKTLFNKKKSDTIFIFGSGQSLNSISKSEWKKISKHNTVGLNYFVHQKWIAIDFHIVRELSIGYEKKIFNHVKALNVIKNFCDLVNNNKFFSKTVFLIQKDFFAFVGKNIIKFDFLKKRKLFFYKANREHSSKFELPDSFSAGLTRQAGAIGAGISFAKIINWKKIVLVGVDLYDSKYFWLPSTQNRSRFTTSPNQTHPTVKRGIISIMKLWRARLQKENIELLVYNKDSLLKTVLPVFDWEKLNEKEQ